MLGILHLQTYDLVAAGLLALAWLLIIFAFVAETGLDFMGMKARRPDDLDETPDEEQG